MSKPDAFTSEPIDGIEMVPVMNARGQVEWFRLLISPKDGQPSMDNVACYGGDVPVYFDPQARRLRLSPKAEEMGWRFYADVCREDTKNGAAWWAIAQEKIKPMVRHPNRNQAWASGDKENPKGRSTFDPAKWYHPKTVEVRNMHDTSGKRLVNMDEGPNVK
jgi:hypothetical protein